jgi:predicted CoA-binding protein
MSTLQEKVDDFLAQKRIAITGVSREGKNAANLIYQKLLDSGHKVFPVNPNTDTYNGSPCYAHVGDIPGGVDAVMIVNRPDVSDQIVHECAQLGIGRVWLHRAFHSMGASFELKTVEFAEGRGMSVIAGGCPMMFVQPVDFGHKCMKWMIGAMGQMPT